MRITPARITCSLLGTWLLLAGAARGQDFPGPQPAPVHGTPTANGSILYKREPVALRHPTLSLPSAPTFAEPAGRPDLPPPAGASVIPTVADEQKLALAQLQGQPGVGGVTEPGIPETKIQLEPPGPDKLFRREREASLFERIRQEKRRPGVPPERIVFPEEPTLSKDRYAGRQWPLALEVVEPNYVCMGRLDFQQVNSERYGWELGFVQPFLCAGGFFFDVATYPYHRFTEPCRCFECNAGYCLPGDPAPYLVYPPKLSLTGLLAETVVVSGLFLIFP